MMTLDEVVYQIDGKLDVQYRPDNTCKLALLDNCGALTRVRIVADCKEVEVFPESCRTMGQSMLAER